MKFSEIAPPGREKQVKKLKKKFDDPGAPYAIAWAQHNKHGKPKKKEALGESDDTTYVKMVIQKYPQEWKKFTDTGDLMDAPNIYEKLFVYFHFDTGEMPYGTAKARDGDPYEWIANKLDDLGLVEGKMSEIDLDIKTLSDAEFEKKYGKSKDQMQKDLNEDDVNEADLNAWYAEQYAKELAEKDGKSWDRMSYGDKEDYRKIANKKYGVVKSEGEDVPTQKGRDAKPEVLTKRAMNVVKKQIKKDANKERRRMDKDSVGEDDNIEEAPFGKAVKSALGRVAQRTATNIKGKLGSIPGLSDLKTSAKAQQNITQIADKTWQEFLQYKQSNPTDDQMKKWFKDRGMEIDSPDQANKDTVIQGVKAGIAQAGGGPAKASQDQTQQKDKFNLSQLQKIEPTATSKTIRAIAQAKAGKTVQGELAVAMQPLMTKFANALQNPTKRQRLAVALAESLSQSDLSKLDMLAREGMVPKNKVARFKTAMRTLAKGKDLPISYKDDVIDVVTKLAKIITKPSVMGMVRKGLKEEHKQTAQEKFKTWVNQANDIIS